MNRHPRGEYLRTLFKTPEQPRDFLDRDPTIISNH